MHRNIFCPQSPMQYRQQQESYSMTPYQKSQRQAMSPQSFIRNSIAPAPFQNIINRPSDRKKHSSKQTKLSQVTHFEPPYSFRKPVYSSMSNMFDNIPEENNPDMQNKMYEIQGQMQQLNSSICDLELQFDQAAINKLGFIHQHDDTMFKQVPVKMTRYGLKRDLNEVSLFQPNSISCPQLVLGKPDDKQARAITMMSQNIQSMVGRLSAILKNPTKPGGDSAVFTFNKILNKFTRVYQCKFCDLKFNQACSLGGHISRVHKEESQNLKNNKTNARHRINKQRKQAVLRAIVKEEY